MVVSAEEAMARADEVGFPMVVKLVSRNVTHRSDVGAVVLGIEDTDALAKAIASVTSGPAGGAVEGLELPRDLRDRIEAMIGFTHSPPFGALMAVGSGGAMVELAGDRALGLAPTSVDAAEARIRATRLGRSLEGYRNLIPKTDVRPLARLLADMSSLAFDFGDTIAACDLNPVLVEKQTGAVHVVDALVIGSGK